MSKNDKKAYIYKMSLVPGNILCIVIFILAMIPGIIFKVSVFDNKINTFLLFLLLILYLWCHELLHGFGFIIGGAKRKNVKYGICLEKGIFYCMACQELTKINILISLLMPFFVIGIVTYVIGIILNLPLLIFLSIVNISGASMDLAMFFYILRLPKSTTYSESGKPDQFVLISDTDLKKKKSLFLKVIEEKEYKVEDYIYTDVKRLDITKKSIILIVLFLLFGLLVTIL